MMNWLIQSTTQLPWDVSDHLKSAEPFSGMPQKSLTDCVIGSCYPFLRKAFVLKDLSEVLLFVLLAYVIRLLDTAWESFLGAQCQWLMR